TEAGGGWRALRKITVGPLLPESPQDLDGPDDVRRWSRHSHIEVEVQYEGSPRVLDLVVYERPWVIAYEADDASDLWCSHLWASGHPDGQPPSLQFPWQRLSEASPDGDPRG